jgi:immune inhibitor A
MPIRAAHVTSLFVLVFALSLPLRAMPAHPSLLQSIAKHEVARPYYLEHEREIRSRGVDNPANIRTIDQLRRRSLDENLNILAILVQFSDHRSRTDSSFFDRLLFSDSTGTLRHFYSEVSYGTLTLVTVNLPSSLGWSMMPETYSYYVAGNNGFGAYPTNAQRLAEDAVWAADPFVDFSQYDNNGDGQVDGLFIIHSGPGAEMTGNSNDIWSHMWSMAEPPFVDGVTAAIYSMEPEYWRNAGDMTCGVYAHEMGHSMFGLPDLYDYDYDSNGLGDWTLMASGSWNGRNGASPAHPDGWCMTAMGLVTPINITANRAGVSIPSVNLSPTIYRVWTNGDLNQEYFLVENRRRLGYDSEIPGEGLLIYHVDEAQQGNDNQWYPPDHMGSGHYEVALEQADGNWELEQEVNAGDGSDPYPGFASNFTFSNSTTPDSRDYSGANTRVAIRNISLAADTMTADFAVRPGAGNYVMVAIPDTLGVPGRPMILPVVLDTVTGQNISSFQLTVLFNSALLSLAEPYFDRTNSLVPESWSMTQTHTTQSLTVQGSGSTPLQGIGELVRLQFAVRSDAAEGATSIVSFSDLTFNQGTPGADPDNGSVRIVVPRLRVMPATLNFPGLRVGQSAGRSFLASNAGESAVTIDSIRLDSPFSSTFVGPVTLPTANTWQPIRITFAPAALGNFTDTIIVYSDAIEAPYYVIVTGEGGVPEIAINPSSLNFDSVAVGSELVRNISVEDTGSVFLVVQQMSFVDGSRFHFLTPPTLPDTIAADGFLNYTIQFSPVMGLCRDTLIIHHDAGDSTRVPLQGIGVPDAVGDPGWNGMPADFSLSSAFPNPFNPATSITYALPRAAWITLKVYDLLGREVDAPVSGMVSAGYHSLNWNGAACGSGIYLFVLSADNRQFIQKATLIK